MSWRTEAKKKLDLMPLEAKEIRERALNDLYFFAKLVNPGYMYGSIHREIFRWLQDYDLFTHHTSQTSNKLIMLPRAHLKSHVIATFGAWIVARHPEISILYLSATAELAITQLYAIKNILTGTKFQRYFPEYIHPQEGKREKWSETTISVDHIQRKQEGIRDATIKCAGLTTNTTGWHADLILADDLVVPENAYTEEGRESVRKKSSQFTSIRNPGGFTLAAGTRYHPVDIYHTWKNQVYKEYDEENQLVDVKPVWEVIEHVVEIDNIFLWPRVVRADGKAFGFDLNTLSRIKGEYSDRVQYYAQYYNDPNDPQSERISRDKFQYYNPRLLVKEGSRWFYNHKRLNIYAAIDFAFSFSAESDYTAIVVVGIDSEKNHYILDIDRWKTKKIIDYFRHIKELHSKWRFNKLNAEVTVAQVTIVDAIKDYVKQDGLRLSVVEYRPSRAEGRKEERIAAVLEPLYEDYKVWHFEGGWTSVLEEELVLTRPPHDDIKDAMASACSIAVAPAKSKVSAIKDFFTSQTHSRFGGVAYR